jgi:hypothetical protein
LFTALYVRIRKDPEFLARNTENDWVYDLLRLKKSLACTEDIFNVTTITVVKAIMESNSSGPSRTPQTLSQGHREHQRIMNVTVIKAVKDIGHQGSIDIQAS